MKKFKILPAVIAIIVVFIAGEGIFACAQALQNNNIQKEYEQKFAQTLLKMEKMEDNEFGNIEAPSLFEPNSIYIYRFNYASQDVANISEELESLRSKLPADIYADAFLNYDLEEMAQVFLAYEVTANCYSGDEYQTKSSFGQSGDAFFEMLSSDKISDEAKESILTDMETSKKNQEKWNDFKIDLLSRSRTLSEFESRATKFFNSIYFSTNEEDVETSISKTDKQQLEFVLKKCREWVDNPDNISNVTYMGAISILTKCGNLSEDEKDELYNLARETFDDLYESKNADDLFLANNIINWLYTQENWENFAFLESMSEKFNADSSLYSLILLSSMCETLNSTSSNTLISQLKKDPSAKNINTAVELLKLSYQANTTSDMLINTSITTLYSYLDSQISKLPAEQQPLLPQKKWENDSYNSEVTSIFDLDGDNIADKEHFSFYTPAYYEATFGNGDKLSYKFPNETEFANFMITQMRDIDKDGKNEVLMFGYQNIYLSEVTDSYDTRYFCLVMKKKDNTYTVVPTKSGDDCYYFYDDFENSETDLSDNWISQLEFS